MNMRSYERLLKDYDRDRLIRSEQAARETHSIYRTPSWRVPEWVYDLAWLAVFAVGLGAIGMALRAYLLGG